MIDPNKKKALYDSTEFGTVLYNGHVPMSVVSKVIGVSRQAVYKWLQPDLTMTFANGLKREAFTRAIAELIRRHSLPDYGAHPNTLVTKIKPTYESELEVLSAEYKTELSLNEK